LCGLETVVSLVASSIHQASGGLGIEQVDAVDLHGQLDLVSHRR
jgi:hypothetical protein